MGTVLTYQDQLIQRDKIVNVRPGQLPLRADGSGVRFQNRRFRPLTFDEDVHRYPTPVMRFLGLKYLASASISFAV